MYKGKGQDVDPMEQKISGNLAEIKKLNDEVIEFWDKVGDAEPDAEGLKAIGDKNRLIEELEHKVKEEQEKKSLRDGAYDRRDKLNEVKNAIPYTNRREFLNQITQSAGDRFVNSPEFKSWVAQVAPNGTPIKGARLPNSGAVDIKTLVTGASSTSAGALIINDRLPIVDPGTSKRELTIRDIITNARTGSDTVEYAREGSHTNNAATVAEATATSGATGSKPESAIVLSVVTEAVKTIAHWVPTSRRAIADAPQIQSIIDASLLYGLMEELEDQIVAGDGTGENFTGLLNISGTTSQAYDTSILKTTRKARTKVKTTGRANPTAFLLHPNDWEAIDLLTDNETRYYFGGPAVLGNAKLWGLPVVECEAMTEGTGMVADFRLAYLWDREQASIMMSDSHSDFFTRNLIAILAEMRAAFGVLRPAAFVEIDLTA